MTLSFFQFIIVIILLFLMFGDFKILKTNFKLFQSFFFKKNEKKQEKRDSNP
jgi:hypothetical protein